ncbi:MAG: hypothetical protein R3207_04605 [Oceanospirillum sp.]|nr:hypothetical protein [Oceanospirillum sp.]
MALEMMVSLILTAVIGTGLWMSLQQMAQKPKAIRIKADHVRKDRWDNPTPRHPHD